jgi:hypothetical protein
MYSAISDQVAKARIDDWHRQARRYGLLNEALRFTSPVSRARPGPLPRLTLAAVGVALLIVIAGATSGLASPVAVGGHFTSARGRIAVCLPKSLPSSGICRHGSETFGTPVRSLVTVASRSVSVPAELPTSRAYKVTAVAAGSAPEPVSTSSMPQLALLATAVGLAAVAAATLARRRVPAA